MDLDHGGLMQRYFECVSVLRNMGHLHEAFLPEQDLAEEGGVIKTSKQCKLQGHRQKQSIAGERDGQMLE
eukprot:5935624-Amphidinium_carterae.1